VSGRQNSAKPPRNRARCRRCGDIIESRALHDFVWCRCRAIAVDGGDHYRRRLGASEDLQELGDEPEQ